MKRLVCQANLFYEPPSTQKKSAAEREKDGMNEI